MKTVIDFMIRYGSLALALVLCLTMAFDESALRSLLVCVEAVLVTVALASFAAWTFTSIDFTKSDAKVKVSNTNPIIEPLDEIITASKYRVLGYIFLGVSIVVGLVYWGTYYIQTIPQ